MFLKNFLPEPPEETSSASPTAGEPTGPLPAGSGGKTGEKPGGIISSLLSSLGGLFSGEESPAPETADAAVAGATAPYGQEKSDRAERKRIENEWRAYHQALDSAWRSYHLGEEAAGAQNALDQGVGSLFGEDRTAGKDHMERHNRGVGARLGAQAKADEEVQRLVHDAWENGELLYEDDPAYQPPSGDEKSEDFVGPPAPSTEPPAKEPGIPGETRPETPDERGMRLGRELFGTP
jgi:hypothetical protein